MNTDQYFHQLAIWYWDIGGYWFFHIGLCVGIISGIVLSLNWQFPKRLLLFFTYLVEFCWYHVVFQISTLPIKKG